MSIIASINHRIWRLRRNLAFRRNHGHFPNLSNPRTFSEKLHKRILDGQDPLYPQYGLKHLAHHFVKGRGIRGLKLAPHLKVLRRIAPADFADLPQAFVIKSSFGSGLNEVVLDKDQLDLPAICERFNSQLDGVRNARNERSADNVILFEAFIGDPDSGTTPDDYKFHCFHRQNGSFHVYIQVDSSRFGAHRQTVLDAAFQPAGFQFSGQTLHETPPAKPDHLDDMVRIARDLSSGFDYVRIDLFDTPDGVYFGEITPFHRGGTARIMEPEWEQKLGDLWDQRFPDLQLVKQS